MFESVYALSFLVLYLLKDPFLFLFTSLKTVSFHLKNCFFPGNKEKEKKAVLAMKGKKEAVPLPEEIPNPNKTSRLEIQPTQGNSLSVPDQYDLPRCSRGFSLHQDSTNLPYQGNNSETQLFPRDRSLSENNNDFGSPASPHENSDEDLYLQWLGSGLCAATLLMTSQIAMGFLRKLNFTQSMVKKMIDKGVPTWFLSWIRHPNPGLLPEKPLFFLMVCILAGNLIILYVLIVMVHIIP